jgi:predicted dehydrogenase
MSAYWPAGHVIGYEHTFINTLRDALTNLATGQPISPSLEDGFRNQRVLDAVERSAASRTWIEVDSGPT